MDEDTNGPRSGLRTRRLLTLCGVLAGMAAIGMWNADSFGWAAHAELQGLSQPSPAPKGWSDFLTGDVLLGSAVLLGLSAFFSGSEVAFFSIHQIRLRSMRESDVLLERFVARLMEHPGKLLTSILMGNSIVNVLLSIILAARIEELFAEVILPPNVASPVVSYAAAVALCTALLVSCGEIMPKLVVVRNAEPFARAAAVPMYVVSYLLGPIRAAIIQFITFIFRVTRFSEVAAAPFITDDEFKSLLSESEVSGVIEEEERQMIEGILEFSDVMVREILVPRPDMVALKETATVGEALTVVREQEYARIPVYRDDLDHITGIVHAKDLLAGVERGELDKPAAPMARKAHFVPETMVVSDFVKTAQRLHAHMAIAVDEYGGTSGLVTLQDALREVVGDIGDEDDPEEPLYHKLAESEFRLDGSLPLPELEEITGRAVEDEEHTTVAGYVMGKADGSLSVGDVVECAGLRFVIEKMEGKRVSGLKMVIMPETAANGQDRSGGARR